MTEQQTSTISTTLEVSEDGLDRIIELARESVEPISFGDYGLVLPDGTIVDVRNYEYPAERPDGANIERNVETSSTKSAIDYLARHATATTELHLRRNTIDVIIDAPAGGGLPEWEHHRMTVTPRKSWEWQQWAPLFGTVDQTDLASALQQLMHTIAEPAGARLLDLAEHLEASIGANFAAGQRLDNGARKLVYEEQITTTMEVPAEIVLLVPIFTETDPTTIRVRVGFTIRERKVRFVLTPTEPVAELERRAIEEIAADIVTEHPNLLVIRH